MQDNLLSKYKDVDFKVYAIWMPVIRNDSRLAVPDAAATLKDHRVTQYWNESRLAGKFFKDKLAPDIDSGLAWDMYFLFDETAKWDTFPSPVVDFGGTVIGASASLEYEFGELVKNSGK